jgi:hypothetical protein
VWEADVWELILKLSESFLSWLRPPLALEVGGFYFQDVRSEPGNSLVSVTPYPRRYIGELSLTNRADKVVFVKSVVLTRCGGRVSKKAEMREPLRLESHEPKKYDVTFPLDDNEAAVRGQFKIEVIPSVGRKSVRGVNLS